MGNNNTTGSIEEKARDEAMEAHSSRKLEEENRVDETKDSHEIKNEGLDFNRGIEDDRCCLSENPKDSKDSSLKEATLVFGNEMSDQNESSNLKEELRSNGMDSYAKESSTILNFHVVLHEAIETKDGSIPRDEIEGSCNPSEIEPKCRMIDTKAKNDSNKSVPLNSSVNNGEKSDNLVDGKMDSESSDETIVSSLNSSPREFEKKCELPNVYVEKQESIEVDSRFDHKAEPIHEQHQMCLDDSSNIELENIDDDAQPEVDSIARNKLEEDNNKSEDVNDISHDVVTTQSSLDTTDVDLPRSNQSDSDMESKPETLQEIGFEPKPKDIGVQTEMRKSPSFDFGMATYTARCEESDQTPLLYNDRAMTKIFSSCSARFQIRNVECSEKPLQSEAVEVEEKTIRMERSNSESSGLTTPSLESPKVNVDVKMSPENEDCSAPAPAKEVGKKKARPWLFTTCICCSGAIS
ncbi:uncharacterized protein LOC127250569 isoform X2 [Andrographis paniculata]|uniref:uncharacterized protein LOC127250569 isoform X2 n=1 Tax=Andrographis paniculata TaxID=175694 RepID=UPI0021E98672|nr:uncharacterized protein LOC127250569 isoform X2 [Andrographis paniculata]